MLPIVASDAPDNGGQTTISDETTWSSGGVFNGDVVIESGGSLHVTSSYSVDAGSSIRVEEGGILTFSDDISFGSDDVTAGRILTLGSQLHLNFGDLAQTGTLQLHLDEEVDAAAEFNATLLDQTVDVASVGSKVIQFNDVPLNGTTVDVNFSILTFSTVKVTKAIAIYNGGDMEKIDAEDMNTTNTVLWWYEAAFDVVVYGEMTASDVLMRGANITCHGSCSFDDAVLIGSAPIEVKSEGEISVLDSVIMGSRADEDIILIDEADISYINSEGTGGFTDAWVRLLSSRTIITNIPNGSIDIYGLGYGSSNWNDLTDEDGRLVLVGEDENEHRRMIEWMDGNGDINQEDATITLSISSNWGVFSTTIDAPLVPLGYLNLSLPYIVVDQVEASEVTGDVNKSIGLMLTVSNSGTEDAVANFRCYVDGEDADTAPSTITVELGAGNSSTIPITWWANKEGAQQLSCKPFLPTLLEPIADLVVDEGGAVSQEVSWTFAEESEDKPLIIYAVVIIAFVAGGFFLSRKRTFEDGE